MYVLVHLDWRLRSHDCTSDRYWNVSRFARDCEVKMRSRATKGWCKHTVNTRTWSQDRKTREIPDNNASPHSVFHTRNWVPKIVSNNKSPDQIDFCFSFGPKWSKRRKEWSNLGILKEGRLSTGKMNKNLKVLPVGQWVQRSNQLFWHFWPKN